MTAPGQTPPAQRVAALDGLRGVLACVVVLWHITPNGAPGLLLLANTAVAFFFVISGYVLTRSWYGRLGVFMLRRALRLWPVYAVCLGSGYWIAGVSPVWSEFLWYPFIGPNARPAIDPPVWSLFLEVWATPFIPLISWCGAGSFRRVAVSLVTLILLGVWVPQIAVGALFVAGAYFSRSEFRNRVLESRIFQFLGCISYSLYLSHALVIELAKRVFGPWGGVIALPAIVLVAFAMWRLVERPSILASRRVSQLLAGRLAQAELRSAN